MARRLRYSQHALERLGQRAIQRRWVDAVVGTRPTVYSGARVYTLSANELASRFGRPFARGLRVVVDAAIARVVTVHWLDTTAS